MAQSKQSGRRCRRRALPGKRVCAGHGGRSTGPRTARGKAASSQNARKHGIYAERILDDTERQIYEAMVRDLSRDFGLAGSPAHSLVEASSMAFLQLLRAMRAGHAQAAATFDRRMRRHLKALRAAEGEVAAVGTTPAERAAALLEKLRRGELGTRGKVRRCIRGDGASRDVATASPVGQQSPQETTPGFGTIRLDPNGIKLS